MSDIWIDLAEPDEIGVFVPTSIKVAPRQEGDDPSVVHFVVRGQLLRPITQVVLNATIGEGT